MKRIFQIGAFVTVVVGFCLISSCSSNVSLPAQETITRMNIIMKSNSTLHIDTFSFIQFKPNPATRDSIRLTANTTYAVQVQLLNEAATPTQVVSDTISALADIHLLVIQPDPLDSLLSVKILDKDSKGLPLGLFSTIKTSGARYGFLHLALRHQPGSKNGTETPGESDFEADYPVVVR